MKPEEQRRMQDRMREWANLTPEQRAKVRDSYKEFNQLPSEQKQTVKQKWEAYSNLPPEEKQRVRQEGKSSQLLAPPASRRTSTGVAGASDHRHRKRRLPLSQRPNPARIDAEADARHRAASREHAV